MNRILIAITIIVSLNCTLLKAQTINPDNIELVKKELNNTKKELSLKFLNHSGSQTLVLERMLELGMWQEALKGIHSLKKGSPEQQLLLANYLILNNDFSAAEKYVNIVLGQDKQNE
ncbi:hypothetical protein, partial [Daejeonella sp.]|uniref:hypothetical protein n=1 Tax=Daejeonella sp. TaxID=2805397 RepID=UPI0037851B00